MSEPKLISPLLDNIAMGDPISDHNGVRCCPAMEKTTDDKYIVKIISVPSSQSKLEALLLSGAYPDKESALSYFKAVSDGIIEEAEILQKLSSLDGFTPYEKWQCVPMDEETGFDVYLLGTYKQSLYNTFRHEPLTYLGALNLGLDLCAALSVCRRLGYLYVDLKPENIYLTGEKEYRIGDIGFLRLDSLKYASLPDRYRSQYTAPEIADAFSALNTTIDIYAVGMILYQAFNDGVLPCLSEDDPDGVFPPPAYADYEMAEIILKACDPNPETRWQDPVEMGQALINYMQRNSVNDTPIVPVVVEADILDEDELQVSDEDPTQEADAQDTDETICEEVSTNEESAEADKSEAPNDPSDDIETLPDDSDVLYTEDKDGNITFLSDTLFDEPDPDQNPDEIDYEEVTDEVSNILTQADDLIAHPAPDPVIPPEPIDVPIPDPLPVEEEPEEEVDEEANEEESTEDAPVDLDDTEAEVVAEDEAEEANDDLCEEDVTPAKRPNAGRWLWTSVLIVLAAALAVVGYMFYKNYYLQPIESIVFDEITSGTMTVHVSSQTDESKLIVVCSDTYGNQFRSPVKNGIASFTGLAPDSAYTVRIEIDGFHRLTGTTNTAFTTPVLTNIVQFQAVTGSEDGSAILSFTIDGPDAEKWSISYVTDGEEAKSTSFTGHMATITGLTVGKEYNFTLTPEEDLEIAGTTQIKHVAKQIIKAEELLITGCVSNKLTAVWSVPKDTTVESWTVRCYNESGYDQTVVVKETSAVFEGIDPTQEHTVEVIAEGMSVNQRTYAPANAINVVEFRAENTNSRNITLTWKINEDTTDLKWVLIYTVDGSTPQEVQCEENTATIYPAVPGAQYSFTLQSADGSPVLGGVLKHRTDDIKTFSLFNVTTDNMEFKLCKRPDWKYWDHYDLKKSDYTNSFSIDEKVSVVVHLNKTQKKSTEKITTLFVIRDSNGNIVNTGYDLETWNKMWTNRYCELDVPSIPKTPGEYSISIFFSGMLAHQQNFTVKG